MSLFRKKRGTDDTIKHGAQLITVADPRSAVAEQFRTIRTNINFMAVDEEINTLAFTSANISEGKVGGQAVLGRQHLKPTPWLTERHGYDPTL